MQSNLFPTFDLNSWTWRFKDGWNDVFQKKKIRCENNLGMGDGKTYLVSFSRILASVFTGALWTWTCARCPSVNKQLKTWSPATSVAVEVLESQKPLKCVCCTGVDLSWLLPSPPVSFKALDWEDECWQTTAATNCWNEVLSNLARLWSCERKTWFIERVIRRWQRSFTHSTFFLTRVT